MRARLLACFLALASVGVAAPAIAHRSHHHVGIGVSLAWGGLWYWPYWYGPARYAPVDWRSDVAAVDTDVEPEHARVYLDGELIGSADDFDGFPGYLLLRPGHYKLEFRLPGYQSETLELDARAGRFFPVELELKRMPGEAATPWYDRPPKPSPDQVFGPPKKPAGGEQGRGADITLRPELVAPTPAPVGEDVEQKGASEATPRAAVEQHGAALDLRITPENASVYLDGEFIGTGEELKRLERGLAVSPGHHRLEVLAPDHAPRRLDVSVTSGERQQVVVELEAGAGQTR